MLLHKKLENILKRTKVQNYKQLAIDLTQDDFHYFNKLFPIQSRSLSRSNKILESCDEIEPETKTITYNKLLNK